MTPPTEPPADHLTIPEVAAKLGRKRRLLESRLAEDARKAPAERRLQFHSYIGRSRIWDEHAYRALRAAVVAADSASRPTPTARSTFPAPSRTANAYEKACELIARTSPNSSSPSDPPNSTRPPSSAPYQIIPLPRP